MWNLFELEAPLDEMSKDFESNVKSIDFTTKSRKAYYAKMENSYRHGRYKI